MIMPRPPADEVYNSADRIFQLSREGRILGRCGLPSMFVFRTLRLESIQPNDWAAFV